METELRNYLNAFNEQRWDDLKNLLDDSFTYYTDNCSIQNKHQFIQFMSANAWTGSSYEISDFDVTESENKDLAVTTYKAKFNGIFKDKPMTVKAIETTIFKKINNEWKLIHSHTSNEV